MPQGSVRASEDVQLWGIRLVYGPAALIPTISRTIKALAGDAGVTPPISIRRKPPRSVTRSHLRESEFALLLACSGRGDQTTF